MGRKVRVRDRLTNVFEDNQPSIASHQDENHRNDVPLNELGFAGRTARSRPTGTSAANSTFHVVILATSFRITN